MPSGDALAAVIDLGSSAIKAFATRLRDAGDWQCLLSQPTPSTRTPDGGCLLDALQLDEIFLIILDRLADHARRQRLPLALIALTGQVGGCVLLDASPTDARPLLAITVADTRCKAQADALTHRFDNQFEALLGHHLPTQTCWLAPKLRCLHEQEPSLLSQAGMILPLPAYMHYRLTGRRQATSDLMIGLADQAHGGYALPLLDWAGVGVSRLPALDSLPVAELDRRWASRFTDLPRVVLAGGDMYCAMHGLLTGKRQAFIQSGTTEIVGRAVSPATRPEDARAVVRLPMLKGWGDGPMDVLYGSTNNGGMSLDWLAREHGIDTRSPELWQQAADLSPDADGVIFIPHVDGARAPHWRTDAQGGWSQDITGLPPARLLRTVLEGCAMNKRSVLQAVGGEACDQVILAGGGARQALANHIRAQVLGTIAVVRHGFDVTAAGALAMAMQRAPGIGPGMGQAWLSRFHAAQGSSAVEPDPAQVSIHQRLYQRFLRLERQALGERSLKERLGCHIAP